MGRASISTAVVPSVPLPKCELDLERFAEVGVSLVSTVADDVLKLVQSDGLRNEEVIMTEARGNTFSRIKTNADRICNESFRRLLRQELPEVQMVSETSAIQGEINFSQVERGATCAIVDPIDGTVHLQHGRDEWVLNLAFAVKGVAVVGISALPAKNKIFLGVNGLPSVEMALDGSNVRELSRPHRDVPIFTACHLLDLGAPGSQQAAELQSRWKQMAALNNGETKEFGSAYSYLAVANGEADVCINMSGNFHWDKAAQQVILEGARARLIDNDWTCEEIIVNRAPTVQYSMKAPKDNGHIAVGSNIEVVRIDPALRMQWESRLAWGPIP